MNCQQEKQRLPLGGDECKKEHPGWSHPKSIGEVFDAITELRLVFDVDGDYILWASLPTASGAGHSDPLLSALGRDRRGINKIREAGYTNSGSRILFAFLANKNRNPEEARLLMGPQETKHGSRIWDTWLIEDRKSPMNDVLNEVRQRLGMEN